MISTFAMQNKIMKDLLIPETTKTPKIDFKKNGELHITGNSYPENVNEFYGPITQWLENFLETANVAINLNVDLKYINTSSVKCILNIMTMIGALSKNTVNVAWIYEIEDEDMQSTGEDLEKLTKLKFEFIEK